MQYPNQFHDLLEQVRDKVESTTPVPKPDPAEKLLPTPLEIHNRLSETVIGHSEAKLALAVAVYNHAMQCAMADLEGGEGAQARAEHHLWLCGPTASGKTLLLETLGKLVGLPVLHLDCANLAPHGYKGSPMMRFLRVK